MEDKSSKITLREEVKRHIIKGIGSGRYKFGERIVETRLARELKVSQAPVREAILELSIMGVLEERPFAGSFVREPDENELDNHYKTRMAIETFAASQAAENITDEELQSMRFILHEMGEAKDIDAIVNLDHDFHGAIIDAAHNSVLKRIWESLSVYETTYQSVLTNRWTVEDLHALHRRLYDGIASHNPSVAEAEMYLHIHGFRDGVLADMKENNAKGEKDA